MKGPIALRAAKEASSPGCAFMFLLGLKIEKYISKTRISAGPDLAMLSITGGYRVDSNLAMVD